MDNGSSPSGRDPFKELPVKDFSYVNTHRGQQLRPKKRWPMLLIVGLVLIGAAVATYFITTKPYHRQTANSNSQTSSNVAQSSNTIISGPITNYFSTTFGLSLNYPKSWILSDNGSNLLSITSTPVSLMAANHKLVNAKIVIIIQPQGQVPSALGATGSVAVLASQLVNYSTPTADQRASTYISFVQYPATTILGGLDGIYITGNNGYQKGQDIPGSDMAEIDPLVGATFGQCLSSQCLNFKPLTIASTEWNNLSFKNLILDIFKSLSFS